MPLKRTVPPTTEPVTLAMAKAHLRVDDNEEDPLIAQVIEAAREWCEDFQRRSFCSQTWRLTLDEFPSCDVIELPRPPLASVSSITYVDSDGATQTLSSGDYTVDTDSEPGRVILGYDESWPSTRDVPNAVTITYVAGYGANDSFVPAKVKQAMLLLIGHWFENREDILTGTISKQIEKGAEALLWPQRVNIVG